jgi:alpha,alpha-trehalose phosphorylase
LVDNNVYTNAMAARNLLVAADVALRHRKQAAELGVDEEEIASWRDAADAIVIPFDPDLKVTSQCDGFTRYRKWNFETTGPDDYPLLLHYHNYLLYSSQVVKQADLVFALYACGRRCGLRRDARPRGEASVRPQAPITAHAAELRPPVPWPPASS